MSTTKPKILIYCDSPVFGGSDLLIAHLLNDDSLRSKFEFSLACRSHPRFDAGLARALRVAVPTTKFEFPDRVAMVESLAARLPAAAMLPIKAALRAFDLLLFPYEVHVLRRLIAAQRPALVHVNNGGYPGALGARAAAIAGRLAGTRVLMTVHNLARPSRAWNPFEKLIDRWVGSSCATAPMLPAPMVSTRSPSVRDGETWFSTSPRVGI